MINCRWLCQLLFVGCCLTAAALAGESNWPGFRGTGDSHAEVAGLPLNWGDGQNLAWTRDLPGYGQSSPVIWNDRVFVTSVRGGNKDALVVSCIDLQSGDVVWQKETDAANSAKVTDYISKAAPTPVVDAERVYAFFESGDLLAYTHAGEPVWTRSLCREFGEFQGNHGIGTSPAQTDHAVVLLIDHSGPSYLIAVDKQTGQTLWKKDREPRVSWSSPVICPGSAGSEILVSSNGVAQAFSARTGGSLWEVTGIKGNTVASPSVTDELVLAGSGQPGDTLLIRRGGHGDVTATHVTWRGDGVSTSFGSPLVAGGRAYFVNKSGVAFAVDLATGTTLWTQRLPDSTWASPVAAGDRVYFFCKNGVTTVVAAEEKFAQLAENKLSLEGRVYGVAVADGSFVIRTGTRLVRIRADAR